VRPTIDPGASGSKSVKVNRSAIWHIKCKGEPPPTFSWYKDGELLVDSPEIAIQNNEYQGGSTTMLQIVKSKVRKMRNCLFLLINILALSRIAMCT
jgi:hypothetical protein